MLKSISFLALLCFCLSIEGMEEIPPPIPSNFSLYVSKGMVSHPVSTNNQEAQRYFDQGLTLIYAFNHDAAFWSFKRAAELDPNLAMAYWGVALSLGTNINRDVSEERNLYAYKMIQEALRLAPNATENEQAYIKALAQRYSNQRNPNFAKLAKQYNDAMREVVEKYPDDLDAATLYAESSLNLTPWNQWDNLGNPLPGTMTVVELLESILKRDPEHLGANHYYIHAIEASKFPERALMSAYRLQKLLPSSGHILHMPSHIFILVGDYHLAAESNEEAVKADKAYIQMYGMQGYYPVHYLSHNLYFLNRAYSMEGRFEDALRAGNELYNFFVPHFSTMPELEYYAPTAMFTLVQFHRWKEILALPPPMPQMQMMNVLLHYARGMAYAGLGDLENAEREQKLFNNWRGFIPQDAAYGYNKAKPIMDIADFTLKAKIAEAMKDIPAAISYLRQAIAIQDSLHYNEPPDWYFPVRETLGGILLRERLYQKAEQVFRADLDKHPRNGRSLFGLYKSLKGQMRNTDAFWIQREFKNAWKYSTTQLSIDDL